MTKMHENEITIDENLVRSLIKNQCPEWANLSLKPVASSGTDNTLFRLGDDYIVRLPRVEWSPGSISKSINKEYEWVPQIASFLKTPISKPIFKGNPEDFYPWPWLVSQWNEGYNPNFENDDEHELLAKELAHFLNEFHHIPLSHGPLSRRGVPLKEVDLETRKAISELHDEFDTQAITALWTQLLNVSAWNKNPVWVHGDFLPGNILVDNHHLSAVIDFSDVGVGDPACDLIIAWSFLTPRSRMIFKENLENIDEDTWKRGCGWALSIALIMLPYYKNSNPYLAKLARRIIENILCEVS